MATCLDARELNEMRARAELMAKFVSNLVSLPFHYFSVISNSYRIFIKMRSYFKHVNMKRLTECYKPEQQTCSDCLAMIYNFEQQMISDFLQLTKYKFIGWGYKRIVNTLEDRAETIILSIDEDAINAINKFIDKIETGGLRDINWQEQLNAL
ncbi:MAG TPA: hypothetical protein VJA64_04875 [Desulfobaccales bacterium]|nr:hypothetical protein [Desulfobaccales bacterium]